MLFGGTPLCLAWRYFYNLAGVFVEVVLVGTLRGYHKGTLGGHFQKASLTSRGHLSLAEDILTSRGHL